MNAYHLITLISQVTNLCAPARLDHFNLVRCGSREGMVSCEYFLQLTQAEATHNALQASASETDAYPNACDMISTTGLNMKATISKAAVTVYWVPVDFCWDSNMATSWLSNGPKRKKQIGCLSSNDP